MLKKVMYVEDDPDIRAVGKIALEAVGGFEVCACESGEQALSSIHGFMPDMLLLDVMMPHMDGPTTLIRIRELENFKAIPAVFITAKTGQHELNHFSQYNVIGVIPKPFDPMALPDQLRHFWQDHLQVA